MEKDFTKFEVGDLVRLHKRFGSNDMGIVLSIRKVMEDIYCDVYWFKEKFVFTETPYNSELVRLSR